MFLLTVGELIHELQKYNADLPLSMICAGKGGTQINVGLDADGNEVYLYNGEC